MNASSPSEGEAPKKPQENFLATALSKPDETSRLIKSLADAVVDSLVKLNEVRNRHERRLAYLVASLLALIIVSGAYLTATASLDPVGFAFLVGPIIGGLITYLVESLSPQSSVFDIA